jgi:hypothetical protein
VGAVIRRTRRGGGSCTLVGARGLARTRWHTRGGMVARTRRGVRDGVRGLGISSGYTCLRGGLTLEVRYETTSCSLKWRRNARKGSFAGMGILLFQYTQHGTKGVAVTYGRGMRQQDMHGIGGNVLNLASASARAPAVSGVRRKRGRWGARELWSMTVMCPH